MLNLPGPGEGNDEGTSPFDFSLPRRSLPAHPLALDLPFPIMKNALYDGALASFLTESALPRGESIASQAKRFEWLASAEYLEALEAFVPVRPPFDADRVKIAREQFEPLARESGNARQVKYTFRSEAKSPLTLQARFHTMVSETHGALPPSWVIEIERKGNPDLGLVLVKNFAAIRAALSADGAPNATPPSDLYPLLRPWNERGVFFEIAPNVWCVSRLFKELLGKAEDRADELRRTGHLSHLSHSRALEEWLQSMAPIVLPEVHFPFAPRRAGFAFLCETRRSKETPIADRAKEIVQMADPQLTAELRSYALGGPKLYDLVMQCGEHIDGGKRPEWEGVWGIRYVGDLFRAVDAARGEATAAAGHARLFKDAVAKNPHPEAVVERAAGLFSALPEEVTRLLIELRDASKTRSLATKAIRGLVAGSDPAPGTPWYLVSALSMLGLFSAGVVGQRVGLFKSEPPYALPDRLGTHRPVEISLLLQSAPESRNDELVHLGRPLGTIDARGVVDPKTGALVMKHRPLALPEWMLSDRDGKVIGAPPRITVSGNELIVTTNLKVSDERLRAELVRQASAQTGLPSQQVSAVPDFERWNQIRIVIGSIFEDPSFDITIPHQLGSAVKNGDLVEIALHFPRELEPVVRGAIAGNHLSVQLLREGEPASRPIELTPLYRFAAEMERALEALHDGAAPVRTQEEQ